MTSRIPRATLTGVKGALVRRMSRRMLGNVPEPVEVVWHNRKVTNFSFSVNRQVQKWDQCDESLKAYAHLAVAALLGCGFCLDFGYFSAYHHGLDVDKAREVPRWRESGVFTPLERDVMAYAEAASQTPPAVTDEMSDRLLAALGPAAMVELASFVALANFMARCNIALGIGSQGYADSCDLKPLPVRSST